MERVIPAGLHRCQQCGEYRGRAVVPSTYRYDLLWILPVSCLCEGIVCKYCKKNAVHRPISNFYDEADGKVWHRPWFCHVKPCDECRERGQEPEGAITWLTEDGTLSILTAGPPSVAGEERS